ELGPAIASVKQARPALDLWAVVVGTDADPQGLERQREQLSAAGARVFTDISTALAEIALRFAVEPPALGAPVALDVLAAPAALNVGVESFHDSVRAQGAAAVQVDWRPPASGDEKLAGILARMKKK
ncbi:MAG TPA: hypothetical protein PK954_17435, partial [Anaerolineales bacterium]|nr:hypothetical protein [Anaerolineales bacterium]